MMRALAVIIVMIFTMPVSYAMLDEVLRKMRLRKRIE